MITNNSTEWYYFIKGSDAITRRLEYICDIELYPDYTELKEEEIAFYLSHPDASAHEVKCLCMDSDLPPAEDEEKYRKQLKALLRCEVLMHLEKIIPETKLRDAQASLAASAAGIPSVLDLQTATDRLRYYNEVRHALAMEENRVYMAMLMATTYDTIKQAFDTRHISEIQTGKEVWYE